MSVTVSVIIPTYNRAQLVSAAIDSVLRQTYRDIEIIVIDDGSTDNTEQQLRRFGDSIVYVKQPNAGVNAARNRGLSLARGRYIALLDNDDLWLECKLELQVAILDRYPQAGFVFSNFYVLKKSGARTGRGICGWYREPPDWERLYGPGKEFSRLIPELSRQAEREFKVYAAELYHQSLFGPVVLPTTTLMRRSCIPAELRFPEADPSCGDWEFFARLSKLHGAVYMDIETALNRSHEDAVRLTRLPQTLQTARRIDMIERVWKADRQFRGEHQAEISRVESELLLKLAVYQLIEGDRRAARASLRRRARLDHLPPRRLPVKEIVCWLFAYLPGGSTVLGLMRTCKYFALRGYRRIFQPV